MLILKLTFVVPPEVPLAACVICPVWFGINNSAVTYDNVPFTVHLTSDIQEFGVVGSDKDGNLLYQFEFDVEESL